MRDAAGRPLVTADTVLTVQLVQSLLRRGFASVYVQNDLLPDLEITEVLTEETRTAAVRQLREAFETVRKNLPQVAQEG